MSVALYIDENVHRGITDGLRIRGVDVLTVQEDGRTSFPDPLINLIYVENRSFCPHPKSLSLLGEGLFSGSPSPNIGRRGWGMRVFLFIWKELQFSRWTRFT